jgi:hypothetical protein
MAKLETAPSIEQILEGMRQLSDEEKRALASIVLSDKRLEAFVEELNDNLTCERAVNEGAPEPVSPDELIGADAVCSAELQSVRRHLSEGSIPTS